MLGGKYEGIILRIRKSNIRKVKGHRIKKGENGEIVTI